MENNLQNSKRSGAVFLLIIVTFFWGITFVIVKEAVEQVGVFFFLAQRFILAFFILFALCLLTRRRFKRSLVKPGLILGALLFGGYAFQTLALVYTTASNTAFLTGLNVVFVPIIGGLMFGQVITVNMKWGVLFAAVGMFLLCTNEGVSVNLGDFLGGICAVCISLHIIFTGKYARRSDIFWLTTLQIGTVGFLSSVISLFYEGNIFIWHPEILWALIICVLFATIFAFLVQTSMQRFTSPTHTALIFCMEPVFAAIYAYIMIDEKLGLKGIAGAALILTGMVISQISFLNQFIKPAGKHPAPGE